MRAALVSPVWKVESPYPPSGLAYTGTLPGMMAEAREIRDLIRTGKNTHIAIGFEHLTYQKKCKNEQQS